MGKALDLLVEVLKGRLVASSDSWSAAKQLSGNPLSGLAEPVVLDFSAEAMDLDRLSDADRALLGQALRAAVDGPFFPEWEFHTLFGLMRGEIRVIADAWPNVDLTSSDVALAVNNALTNLLGYPHGQDSAWPQWIPVDPAKLDELLCRLQGSCNRSYLERLR